MSTGEDENSFSPCIEKITEQINAFSLYLNYQVSTPYTRYTHFKPTINPVG